MNVSSKRRLKPQDSVAAFDSATALVAGLARALEGRAFPALGQEPWKVPLVRASTWLPRPVRLRAYAVLSGREGVPAERLSEVDLEAVAGWVAGHYSPRSNRLPGVMIGSSNGAITHLAAACGVPWLPQTLMVPVRRPGADPQDLASAAAFGERHGRSLLDANPGVALHHMHDPEQDRLSASQMAYFRVKWHRLPAAYADVLARLAPGAPVVVVDDTSTWPVTRVGERHVFQAGAQGGVLPADYLGRATAPAADDEAAEAEWGLDPGLKDAVREWAEAHGHPVAEIRYHGPQAPAGAVADAFRTWLAGRGLPPTRRLLVSSFIVHDPWRTIRTGSVPYWTFFPVRPAAEALADYLDRRGDWDQIAVMLFAHGVDSRGLTPAAVWERLAGRAHGHSGLLGVDRRRWPADFAAFARYGPALAGLPEAPLPAVPMSLDAALAALDTREVSVTRSAQG